mgnify:CR=1 FL=1
MARVYRIANDMAEKEKAVGGLLTFGQAGWIAAGLIVGAGVFVGMAKIMPPVLALMIGLIPAAASHALCPFTNKAGRYLGPVSDLEVQVPEEE